MKDFLDRLQNLVISDAVARVLRRPHRSCRGLIKFKDFCQDVLLRAIKQLDTFGGEATAELLGWLKAIGRQLAAQLRRAPHACLGQALPADLADRDRTSAGEEADYEAELAAKTRWVDVAVAALAPDDRRLMQRHYWGRESLAAIAQSLGLSRNTVTQHHGRLLRRLRARVLGRPGKKQFLSPFDAGAFYKVGDLNCAGASGERPSIAPVHFSNSRRRP